MPGRAPFQPDRGDLVWLDFSPHAGTEQGERRPALVLSPVRFNVATGLALVCPVTSKGKGSPFEIPVPAGLPVAGFVLASHVRTLDWLARRAQRICGAPAALVEQVAAHVAAIMEP